MNKLQNLGPLAKKKFKSRRLIVAHIASARKADGTTCYFWIVTDSVEPPPIEMVPAEYISGPYTTEEAANVAALQALKDLGPQCKIRDRAGWPEKPHTTIQ